MANENEYSNFVTLSDTISAAMAPAFVTESILLPILYTEVFPNNTNTINFRKSGKIEGQILAESAPYVVDANSELSDASVACVAEKAAVATKHSVESLRFGTSAAQVQRFIAEHAAAHGRLFDNGAKALFSSLSNAQTSTAGFTKSDLMKARYQVAANTGGKAGRLVAICSYKQTDDIAQELIATSGTAFTQQVSLGVLGMPQSRGYRGSLLGVDIFETDGLPTSAGDTIGALFDPSLCYATGVDGQNGFYSEIHSARASEGFVVRLETHTFYKTVEWNDEAGVQLVSDTVDA